MVQQGPQAVIVLLGRHPEAWNGKRRASLLWQLHETGAASARERYGKLKLVFRGACDRFHIAQQEWHQDELRILVSLGEVELDLGSGSFGDPAAAKAGVAGTVAVGFVLVVFLPASRQRQDQR